ncbi:MAG TPA: SMP-30/gluconolactonase/LRE family protein [Gemmatimonadaceae bacterium]
MPLRHTVPASLAILLLAACAPASEETPPADTTQVADAAPMRIASIAGFSTPESVVYDSEQDVYYVSNINGSPSAADNDGFISRMRADGTVDSLHFVQGGRGGVALSAPKGMAIVADTLWVSDIDAIRAFNKRTGAAVATINLRGRAKFLNDVAAGPDGVLYVTDTGVEFSASGEMSHPGPDQVLRVTGRTAEAVVQGEQLTGPNGVTWDAANNRLLIVSYAGNSIMSWRPGEQAATSIATGPGGWDGVEVLADGRMLVSSWTDSTVHVLDTTGTMRPLVTGLPSPADIGFDTRRGRVAVPLFMENRVELWEIR